VVDNAALIKFPVPGCMSGEEGLVDSLAIIDGKVVCVLGANRLSAVLRSGMTDDGREALALSAGER
jgi:hypothetical protein